MEGPLLVLKSWLLTALAIWVYRRWFQRVAPATPQFEAFAATQPVVAAIWGIAGREEQVAAAFSARLGRRRASVATLGGFPWPHYRLELAVEGAQGVVRLRVQSARVVRTKDRELVALATLVRDTLNELPEGARGWLHTGAFNNGLVQPPNGGWLVPRGSESRPRLSACAERPSSLCLGEPQAALVAVGHGVNDAVPRVAGHVEATDAFGDGGPRIELVVVGHQ
jgi:hypothetical protein